MARERFATELSGYTVGGKGTVPAAFPRSLNSMQRRITFAAPLLALFLGAADNPIAPRYTANGDLIAPADYREWVYLSSGIDMSYNRNGGAPDMSMFDNVFVDPAAWQAFKRTGHWPDHAMFVMEARAATSHGSINAHGQFQTSLMGAEIHVHDSARFAGGWGFFDLDGTAPAKFIGYTAACYTCHQAHGAVDTTFAQFYPTAKAIAVGAGTYREMPDRQE